MATGLSAGILMEHERSAILAHEVLEETTVIQSYHIYMQYV